MQSQMETLVNILSSVKTQKGKQEIAMRLVEQGVYLPNHE
jgi:hypothetical protein